MTKKFLLVFLILVLTCAIAGEKLVTLSGLGRPVNLDVDDSHLYITENTKVYIYSLKDFKLINKFGQKGQGPGEFQTYPHVHITLDCSTDNLIIGSIRKISYYKKTGEFIKEVKGKNVALRLLLLDQSKKGNRFLGWSQRAYEGFNFNTIVIFDQELKKIQQIYREKDPFQGQGKGYDMLPKTFSFLSHREKILTPGQDDSSIDVFNSDMKLQFTIKVNQKPDKVSADFKKKMTNFIKTSPETKSAYPMIKPLRYPEYFPVINSFFADQGIVYVMTWKRKDGRNEFYTYDLQKGKFIKKMMIPIKYENDNQTYPTIIKNGKLYQLVENIEKQEWDLKINRID